MPARKMRTFTFTVSVAVLGSSALCQCLRSAPVDLPAIIIETSATAETADRVRTAVRLVVSVSQGSERVVEFRGRGELWLRGSSSRFRPKRPYRLELQDENGDDLKASLLGMPKESDWILFPAYTDKTMIRDVLAYELWRRMGHYSPRTRYVELFIIRTNTILSPGDNHQLSTSQPSTNSYEGVYVLMENIKRGKERMNIAKLTRGDNTEPKITGGYIFKRDRTNSPADRAFSSSKGLGFIWEEPKGRDITPEQEQYLTNYINAFETALFGDYFRDAENGYRRHIDTESFIDYHWMVELTRNLDGYTHSQFFHKDRAGKLKAGPIWDYDLGFGNSFYQSAFRMDGWRWPQVRGTDYVWYRRLFDDPDFLQRYIDRWAELRTNVFATSNVVALVDNFAGELNVAQVRNYERWPILGEFVQPNAFIGKTYAEEVNWLKEWIKGRLDWIDSQDFPKPAMVVDRSATEGNEGSEVARTEAGRPSTINSQPSTIRMACLVGKIHYTTDGSDPRLPGGAISPNAAQYQDPIPFTPGLRLFARVRSDYGLWSAPVVYAEPPQKVTKRMK